MTHIFPFLPLSKFSRMAAASGLAVGCLLAPLHGQTNFWTGDGADSTSAWSSVANWSLGVVPDADMDAEIGNYTGVAAPANNSTWEVRNLAFTRDSDIGLRLFGGTLTVNGTLSFTGDAVYHVRDKAVLIADDLLINTNLLLGINQSAGANRQIGTFTILGTSTLGATATLGIGHVSDSVDLGSLQMNGGTFSMLTGSNTDRATFDGGTNVVTVSRLNGSGIIRGSKVASEITTGHLIVDGESDGTYSGTLINGNNLNVIQLTKDGTSTLTLSGANSHSGTTTVLGGVLAVANTTALGTGAAVISGGADAILRIEEGITTSNALTFSNTSTGSGLERALDTGHSFSTGVGSFQSSLAGGTSVGAALIDGTASAATILAMRFATQSSAINDDIRASDVFSIFGTGNDLFVLQLSMSNLSDGAHIVWLDGSDEWINASDGTTGRNASGDQLGFVGSFNDFQLEYGSDLSNYIGAYGFDSDDTWAVVNQEGLFAVIPEPSTVSLIIALLALGCVAIRRAK